MADYSPYEVLGVAKNATDEEIRAAYRRAVRTAHPDRGGTTGMFGMVRDAYEQLSDPKRRADLDTVLTRPAAADEAAAEPPEPEWGEEVDTDEVFVGDLATEMPPESARGSREPFLWRFGAFLVRLGALAVALALGWFLARPAFGGTYRPDAAGADFLGMVERFNLVAVAVIVYLVCIVTSMVGFYYMGLATLTLAAFVGLAWWPFAYWGLAAGAERWQWVGWLAAFLVYQALFVGLMRNRWTNASAERARGEYD